MFYLETQGYARPISLCNVADSNYVAFRINGMHASIEASDEAYNHGCTNSEKKHGICWGSCYITQFEANLAEEGILRKYRITEDEYRQICNKLNEEYDIRESDSC